MITNKLSQSEKISQKLLGDGKIIGCCELVGGFKHFYFPFHIWDVILPIDFHIFPR